MEDLVPIKWQGNKLIILDQTRLPVEEVYLEITRSAQVAEAIKCLAVRGAPAIGVAAAYGVALGALEIRAGTWSEFLKQLKTIMKMLSDSRPTARNLFWAIERMERVASSGETITEIKKTLIAEALKIHEEQIISDEDMGLLGASLIDEGDTILTICNTGILATAGYGTALGVIKKAYAEGKNIKVIAVETRPLLQGARLTAFELKRTGIPFILITDSMAGSFMRQCKVDAVITGADRIARNGDAANKIGTYTLAVLAKEHGLPFYVAAPSSTIDLSIASGDDIVIEERQPEEVTCFQGVRTAPEGIRVANPAFDVTPHEYITAIITEKGIFRGEFERAFREEC
jgi:methylthioribose-1-phosphate isomerase